jgi:ubiquinone/menaquinone biosynthesis C-methylase UbiE
MGVLPKRLRFVLEDLSKLPPAKNLLDAAAGDGRLSAEIAALFPVSDVTAVDLSPVWKTPSESYFTRKKVSTRCRYLLTDLELPWSLPENAYDGAVCVFALHHFRQPEAVLENLYRSLRPGGWLYLADFRRASWLYILPLWNRWMESIRAAYTAPELLEVIKRSGLPTPTLGPPHRPWYLNALLYKPETTTEKKET